MHAAAAAGLVSWLGINPGVSEACMWEVQPACTLEPRNELMHELMHVDVYAHSNRSMVGS